MNIEGAYRLQETGVGKVWMSPDKSKQRLYIEKCVCDFIAEKLSLHATRTIGLFYDIQDGEFKNPSREGFEEVNQAEVKKIMGTLNRLFKEHKNKVIFSIRCNEEKICDSVIHFIGEDKEKLYWKD